MVRRARMRGHPTLWLPGLDHASIAAQVVLDWIIAAEGETRDSLGRERYLERMWQFIDATREVILGQQRRLGGSWTGRACGSRWTRARRGRSAWLQAALRRRPRLPGRGAHQLVPRLPDERLRPGGHPHARDGHALDGPLPPHRRGDRRADPDRGDHGRDDAAGDDPGRYGRRGPSRRRPLPGARRPAGTHPVRRAGRPDHRRRGRRPRVRDRRGQDHPGPRP